MSTPTTTPGGPSRTNREGGDDGLELSVAETERLASEFDEERPGRRLSLRVDRAVNLWCFLVALLVLKQVFCPFAQGNQYYLVIFLGVTLPLVFLLLPARTTARGAHGRARRQPRAPRLGARGGRAGRRPLPGAAAP